MLGKVAAQLPRAEDLGALSHANLDGLELATGRIQLATTLKPQKSAAHGGKWRNYSTRLAVTNTIIQMRRGYAMGSSKDITMKLADVADTLAKEAHDEWDALGKDD